MYTIWEFASSVNLFSKTIDSRNSFLFSKVATSGDQQTNITRYSLNQYHKQTHRMLYARTSRKIDIVATGNILFSKNKSQCH